MIKKLNVQSIKKAYRTAPWFVHVLLSPAHAIYRYLKMLQEIIRVDVWLVKGKEVQAQEPFAFLFNGHPRQKGYFARMVFGGACEEVHLGKMWSWQIAGVARQHAGELDLVIDDTQHWVSSWLGSRRCLCMPAWVGGDMEPSLIDLSGSAKRDVQRIYKNAYTYEMTKDSGQLEHFYKDMCVPYAKERYGGELLSRDYESLVRTHKDMELFSIKKDGVCVAGQLLSHKKNKILMMYIGVRSASRELVRAGVLQAIYYFVSRHFKDSGPKSIWMGLSRAFFQDGVLAFKKKWGLRITHRAYSVMRMHPLQDSRGLRSFLIHHPFIAIDGKDLVGAVFVDKPGELSKEDIEVFASYHWPGLKRVVVYRFGDGPTPPEQKACADYGIDLRSANTLLR